MLESASPIIQVVTTGTDWPAIAAAVATTVAAVGGIWGTARQAKKSREAASEDLKKSLTTATENVLLTMRAEDERAKIAEKRRIYAVSLAALSTCLDAAKRRELSKGTPEENTATREYDAAYLAAMNSAFEMDLIGPPVSVSLTTDLLGILRKYPDVRAPSFVNTYADLVSELRKDIEGLSPENADQ